MRLIEKICENIIERGRSRIKNKGDGLHKHRIVPGYQGGKYTVNNTTLLTRKEHWLVHIIRYRLYNQPGDLYGALKLDLKLPEKEKRESIELASAAGKLGGKIGGAKAKREGLGIFSSEYSRDPLKKKVIVGDVVYESRHAAAKAYGIDRHVVRNRMKSSRFPAWKDAA